MLDLEQRGERGLARVLREWASVHAPEWTNFNDSDPGVTILELFAYATEALLARGDVIPERGRRSAARLARSALALAGGSGPAESCALVRNRYFSGRLLGAEDFQLEQDYVRDRLRRHNRALHGSGVVDGLQVSVRPDGGRGEQVVVQPGVAIAPDGEEIDVPCEASASLPETGSQLFVIVTHAEQFTHPVPASGGAQVEFTRVEESFALHVTATAGQNDATLARLVRMADGWKVDQAFPVPRVQCHRE